jgi:hypothetical protein
MRLRNAMRLFESPKRVTQTLAGCQKSSIVRYLPNSGPISNPPPELTRWRLHCSNLAVHIPLPPDCTVIPKGFILWLSPRKEISLLAAVCVPVKFHVMA